MKTFIREKKVYCGSEYLFPEIYQRTEAQDQTVKGRRGRKQRESSPKQKNLNDKRAKRYFLKVAQGNFGKGDMVVHATYAPENLPETVEEANHIAGNFLRRVAYEMKKRNLPALKYMLVTQYGRNKDGTHRIHHHILISGGLDRDVVESLWWKEKGSKKRKTESVMYGWINADRLKPNQKGIVQMAGYMIKDSAGKKHWTQSQNLDLPWFRKNDNRFSRREIQRVCSIPEDADAYREYWEKRYPGYECIGSEREYNENTGWAVYLTMRRKPVESKEGG